jgi:hypothetical protein
MSRGVIETESRSLDFWICDGRVSGSAGVPPVAEADLLFEEADQLAGFARNDDSRPLKLARRIEDLDSLSRRPDDLKIGKKVKRTDGCVVVGAIADLASDPL